MIREAQLRAAGRLAGDAVAAVVTTVQGVHRAVGRRVETALPPVARGVAEIQSGLSDAVYAGVTQGGRLVPRIVAEVLVRCSPGAPALTETSAGRHALAALNGIWGDTIAERHPDLAVSATLRAGGQDLRLHPAFVAEAVPEATGRIVVFVHGLSGSDRWWTGATAPNAQASYGERLSADLGYVPLYVHYNSGRAVSDNGRDLAELLDRLVDVWPVPVERMALIGHSMGGLVIRSACRHADLADHRWISTVGTVVTLGTPHLGAPLEKAVHVTERLLTVAPETAPLARLLGIRSAGVKDLRFGALVPGDRRPDDPSLLADRCTSVPVLPHVTYCFASASIVRDARSPVGWLLGDGLVRLPSAAATGRTPREPLAPHRRAHFPGRHHVSLLNDPHVYAQLRQWLTDE